MEEEVKKYLLGLIPGKAAMLREKHKRCSEKYPSFWEIFPERFAKKFEAEPEKTLEEFLKLSDEECAWEKGDFRTRSILLDNFIGREIARELKLELDRMEDFEAEKPSSQIEQLLQENLRLKKEKDRLQRELSESKRELEELRKKVEEEGLEEELSGLRSKMEEYEQLRRYCEGLEERLKRCLQRREPKKLARMARILRLGKEVVRFTPSYASRQLGMKPHMVTDYLAELVEAGMLKKIQRGYYEIGEGIEEENLEEEVARRLAERKG
jgi:hypothetical protein